MITIVQKANKQLKRVAFSCYCFLAIFRFRSTTKTISNLIFQWIHSYHIYTVRDTRNVNE